jgi:chitinase
VAVLFLGLYFGPGTYQDYQERKQAELAYQQTKEALNLLAVNFGKGTQKINYLKEFESTTSKIYNDN